MESKVTPPPLVWVGSFIHSIVGALGSSVKYEVNTTVNPLVFRVRILFMEKVSGRNTMLVWNLFQMYASANDSIPVGKVSSDGGELVAEIIIKRRFGPKKDSHPMEKK